MTTREAARERWQDLKVKIERSPRWALDEFGNVRPNGVRAQLEAERDRLYNHYQLQAALW